MKKTRWKFAVFAALLVVIIVFVSAVVFLFYPDTFINTYLKGQIIESLEEAYPAYLVRIGSIHYDVRKNSVGFDSVALTTLDSTLSFTIVSYSLSGIGWLDIVLARGLVPNGFTGTVLDVHGIVVNFRKEQYEARCERLHVSVPDSIIILEAVTLYPSVDDEQLFAGSKFRKTRFRLDVPRMNVSGLACLELLQGKKYHTRSANISDAFIDILINKDKPAEKETSSPIMPNEMLASMQTPIEIDSLNIWNGRIKYGEKFSSRSKPALITFDRLQVAVRRIDNSGEDTVVIRAKGDFMQSAEINLLMSIPISSPKFSFAYSGSVGRMNLIALNSFVEPAEQIRIKSGRLNSGSFDINVTSGQASGSVRAVYKDLTLAIINKRSGSEKGLLNMITSFIANTIKIRTNNLSDKSIKIGKVKYTKQWDDPFFKFVWFALRSGVKDVVGF